MIEVHTSDLLVAEGPLVPERPGDLAAIIASRICHDMASPLGAIANGVELLLLSGAERTPELDLIAQSVEGGMARIRFFRLAFGAPNGRTVGRNEVAAILRGIEKTSRLVFDWTPMGDHPREEVKAVFLLLQCLETALPMGGHLRISREGQTWTLEAEGPRLRVDPSTWAALTSPLPSSPGRAALVQFALLPAVLNGLGRQLDLSFGADGILARF